MKNGVPHGERATTSTRHSERYRAVQQAGAQRPHLAEVVRDDLGLVQTPLAQQVREQFALRA